jgi:hypothetical protein
MLPRSVWGNVSYCVDELQRITETQQPQAVLIQQHLQDLTKALSDVFAN